MYEEMGSEKMTYWYNPLNLKRTYGVVLNLSEKGEKCKVHYECEVVFLKKDIYNCFYFSIHKKQIYINEKLPDIVFDELASQCGRTIYPIEVKISSYGVLMDITNHEEIKERWSNKKKTLAKYYKGKEVTTLFEKMDVTIASYTKLMTVLKKEWFIVLFFSPIHAGYGRPKSSIDLMLDMLPYKLPIKYNVTQCVTENEIEIGGLMYRQKGNCVDIRDEIDILKGNFFTTGNVAQLAKGELDISYEIYKDSPVFDRILGSCSLKLPSGYVKKIEIEIYNLVEKQTLTVAEKYQKAIKQQEKEPKPKKRFTFW
ncbi:MAG: hypothetical protein JKY08_07890 [Flavobacteriaceae bacterium]|nr:hypothetical protein [Flavobacteriaceae bacterium]